MAKQSGQCARALNSQHSWAPPIQHAQERAKTGSKMTSLQQICSKCPHAVSIPIELTQLDNIWKPSVTFASPAGLYAADIGIYIRYTFCMHKLMHIYINICNMYILIYNFIVQGHYQKNTSIYLHCYQKTPAYTDTVTRKHQQILTLLPENTSIYWHCYQKTPAYTDTVTRKHQHILTLLPENTSIYWHSYQKTPAYTDTVTRKHQHILTFLPENTSIYWHWVQKTPAYTDTVTRKHQHILTFLPENTSIYWHCYQKTPAYTDILTRKHQYILTLLPETKMGTILILKSKSWFDFDFKSPYI